MVEERLGGHGGGKQNEQRHKQQSSSPSERQRDKDDRGVAFQLERNGPKLGVDNTRHGVLSKHAGQSKMNQAKDISEISEEFRTRKILPQRHRGEGDAENQRGESHFDGERGNEANRPKR